MGFLQVWIHSRSVRSYSFSLNHSLLHSMLHFHIIAIFILFHSFFAWLWALKKVRNQNGLFILDKWYNQTKFVVLNLHISSERWLYIERTWNITKFRIKCLRLLFFFAAFYLTLSLLHQLIPAVSATMVQVVKLNIVPLSPIEKFSSKKLTWHWWNQVDTFISY